MIYIEDILVINKKLSDYQLIFKKYNLKWCLVIFSTFLPGTGMIITATLPPYMYSWLAIPGVSLTIFSIVYAFKKIPIIIKKNYPYAVESNKFGHSNFISLIRKREFERLLNKRIVLNDEKILFLIEALKRENDSKKYNFLFLTSTLTVLFGAFLGVYVNELISQGNDSSHRLLILHSIALILFLLSIVTWFFDRAFIRDSVRAIRGKDNRVIRILENIYLEKYASYRK